MGKLTINVERERHGQIVKESESIHVPRSGKYKIDFKKIDKKVTGVATYSNKPDAEVVLKQDRHGHQKITSKHISKHSKSYKVLEKALKAGGKEI